jgi:large subunit ribosomal protein L22
MDYGYSCKIEENMAKAVCRDMSVSYKHATEICSYLRGKPLERAKTILAEVVAKKHAVPFRKFYHNVGFKRKIGPGRYPVKAAAEILKLLDNVTNNAQLKGLATGKLELFHICAKKGSKIMRRGRHIGRKMKQTSVEVAVREIAKKKAESAEKPAQKKAKPEANPESLKAENPKPKAKEEAKK